MKNLALPVRFGIIISVCLVAFFLIMSLFNFHTNPLLSLLNGVITGFGIYETIKYYKLKQGDEFTYTGGFTAGIIAGFLATIVFTIFFLFYITEIDALFLSKLLEGFNGIYDVSVGLVTFVVAVMGFATTVVLTLTCMQLFKKSRNFIQNA